MRESSPLIESAVSSQQQWENGNNKIHSVLAIGVWVVGCGCVGKMVHLRASVNS